VEMISLGEGCFDEGTIVHELMHTVGQCLKIANQDFKS
jgi:hypothetical protein